MSGMRVLVCGSRYWPMRLYDVIKDRLNELPSDTEVIQGGSQGADTWARCWAEAIRLPTRTFTAEWSRHGRRAGPIRNRAMLDEQPDLVIAFLLKAEANRGTKDTVAEAQRRGIPVEEIWR